MLCFHDDSLFVDETAWVDRVSAAQNQNLEVYFVNTVFAYAELNERSDFQGFDLDHARSTLLTL